MKIKTWGTAHASELQASLKSIKGDLSPGTEATVLEPRGSWRSHVWTSAHCVDQACLAH